MSDTEKKIWDYLWSLSDESLISMFKIAYGARDSVSVHRRPHGFIRIDWSNDNGFRETGSGQKEIFNIKTGKVDMNFITDLLQ